MDILRFINKILIILVIIIISSGSNIITRLHVNVVLYHSASSLICRWLFHTLQKPNEIHKARLGDGASETRIAHYLNGIFGIVVNSRYKTLFFTEPCEYFRHV